MKKYLFLWLLFSLVGQAYKIDGGELFLSSGVGANVNVIRYETLTKASPGAQMPLIFGTDYAIDRRFGVFGSVGTFLAPGSIALNFRLGGKYYIPFMDGPFAPYTSLALTPGFLFPTGLSGSQTSLGLSPGVGLNYFVMHNFLLGMHTYVNPMWTRVAGKNEFELGVTAFLDATFRI